MTAPQPAPVLLVEDDENDAFFFERALKKSGVPNPLRIVRDGQEAMEFLGALPRDEDGGCSSRPALVILDLNLPIRNGLEVLKWIRSQAAIQSLIVIVLTSSTDVLDMHEAYTLGANSYIVKPADPNRLILVADALNRYWFTFNATPPAPHADSRLAALARPANSR